MYDRAERFISKKNNELSPASYNLITPYDTKACRVPFNCSAPAHALADNNVPAPCTYNITYRKQRVQGGASLKFTEPRDTFKHKNQPSPLTYDPDFVYIRPLKKTIGGKIYRGKPPRYGNTASISVPCKFINGINIITGDFLDLRPQINYIHKVNEPIYYHFPFEVNKTTLKYKGNHWSRMKSERKPHLVGDPCSPGIGKYNLLDKPRNPLHIYLDEVKLYYKTVQKSLRSMDMKEIKLLSLDEPGPNNYIVNEDLFKSSSFNVKGTFSAAKRELSEIKEVPDSDLNLRDISKPVSHQVNPPPFNTSSKQRPKFLDQGRSPADFNILYYTIAYNYPKKLDFEIFAPFFSTSERGSSLFNECETPGPSSYEIKRFPVLIYRVGNSESSYLASVNDSRKYRENEVAPWSYDWDCSFDKVYRPRDFHIGEIWKPVKNDRFDWMINRNSTDVFYSIGDYSRKVGQPVFTSRPIFRSSADSPGPFDYNIHFLYRESVAKALVTFNVSLGIKSPVPRLTEWSKNNC